MEQVQKCRNTCVQYYVHDPLHMIVVWIIQWLHSMASGIQLALHYSYLSSLSPNPQLCPSDSKRATLSPDSGRFGFRHQAFHLDGTSCVQKPIQLSPLRLQVRVATNVLLADEDVGHGALPRDAFECVLQRGTVICYENVELVSVERSESMRGEKHARRRGVWSVV
jgi:hypothetical protein